MSTFVTELVLLKEAFPGWLSSFPSLFNVGSIVCSGLADLCSGAAMGRIALASSAANEILSSELRVEESRTHSLEAQIPMRWQHTASVDRRE